MMSVCNSRVDNFAVIKFFLATLSLLFLATIGSAQDSCVTPKGRSGSCIDIKKCQSIVDILRGPRPLPTAQLEFVRTSQCGFENHWPKFCCENQIFITSGSVCNSCPNFSNVGEMNTTRWNYLKQQGTDSIFITEDRLGVTTTPPSPPDVTTHPNLRLLDHGLCGPISQQKIFGGNKTGVFDFPWMALIAYHTKSGPDFRCGGSLINKRYVLTAAHCVTNLPAGHVLTGVRLGDHDVSKERDCDKDDDGREVVCAERYQDFGVESSHHFPNYSKTPSYDDIALIRLDRDADLRPASVRPICLPIGAAATITQKKVIVTGWGATEFGVRSQDLLKVFIAPVPNEQCAFTYRQTTKIWYKQMCAGGHNRKDSCLGDSGGPLQSVSVYNVNTSSTVKYVQYGIVSFGPEKCGTEGAPVVYTRVAYYLDWILDTMRD